MLALETFYNPRRRHSALGHITPLPPRPTIALRSLRPDHGRSNPHHAQAVRHRSGGRSRRLTLNYRTTAEILDFAMRVLESGAYRDIDDEIEKSNDDRSARGGPSSVCGRGASLTEEVATAAEQVRAWTTEAASSDQPLESIAILVRDQYNRDRVVTGLAERGVTVRSVECEGTAVGASVVMTMHRAKEMEFRDVLLLGIGADSIPRGFSEYEYSEDEVSDALLRERSLLYVASTRARAQLVATWAKASSPLLPAG